MFNDVRDANKEGGVGTAVGTVLAPGMVGSMQKGKLLNDMGVGFKARSTALFRGDLMAGGGSASNYDDIKKVHTYLNSSGKIDDFRQNYGKKGYLLKDVKEEMKNNGAW